VLLIAAPKKQSFMELVESCVFQLARTNLSKEPSRGATMYAAEQAQQSGTEVILDIDFRPTNGTIPCPGYFSHPPGY
jgi:sugar/nucleoside kinase (ribokinase family)